MIRKLRPIKDIDAVSSLSGHPDSYRCLICEELFSYRGPSTSKSHMSTKHHLILDVHGYIMVHRVIR